MTKLGRNQPCLCGSGKKFKHCCSRIGDAGLANGPRTVIAKSSEAILKARRLHSAGHYAQAAVMCAEVLRASSNDPDALHLLAQIQEAIRSAIEGYSRKTDTGSIAALRHVRREVISLLRSLPIESLLSWQFSFLVDAHAGVRDSGLSTLSRDFDDEVIFRDIRAALHSPGDGARYSPTLLAAMLLGQNFEFPTPPDLARVPEWMRDRYCDFLLEMPGAFIRLEDAENYAEYLSGVVALFHRKCIGEHGLNEGPDERALAKLFVSRANFIQAYFNSQNLRRMYELRGDLISAELIAGGAFPLTAFTPRVRNGEKVRVGVFAQTLLPFTETYFTLSHFDFIDRERFDITLYAMRATGTAIEQRCIARADRFKVLAGGDPLADVAQIRADDLDILLIGTNMTAQANAATLLGAHRLARIQIASGSSPVTTGLRHMDIMLSAQWNEPNVDAQEHYSERLWLLPGSVNYYSYQYDEDPATLEFTRSGLGIPEKAIVFFSGANFYKIIPELSQVWTKVLAAIPDSVLLLMPFNRNWSASYDQQSFKDRIIGQLRAAGVDPRRLLIVDPLPARADMHRVLAIADVYLDAFPFAGACSLLDPILVGIPPVVHSGSVGRSNHGSALMRMVELEELICDTDEAYVSLAKELATDTSRRQKIAATLRALQNSEPPKYFDTALFARRVGDALGSIRDQYLARYETLAKASLATLRQELQNLADSVVGRNFELNTLTDIGIVTVLVEPYFRSRRDGRPLHMVDVGACHGVMAAPLLAGGWTATLFEPDPDARAILAQNVSKYGPRCCISGSAVSNLSAREIEFHKASTQGLSGLGASPFDSTAEIIKVPCVRLADFYAENAVVDVDFLKVDAEGFDFDVLDSHDFSLRLPRLVLVEYGTRFPRQSLDNINQAIARMAREGYGAISFNYNDDGNFNKKKWKYRLTEAFIDLPIPDLGRLMFGNILFYRSEDRDFLLTLYSLLENCRPRTEVWSQN
jgi:FkbM family methyltransferase